MSLNKFASSMGGGGGGGGAREGQGDTTYSYMLLVVHNYIVLCLTYYPKHRLGQLLQYILNNAFNYIHFPVPPTSVEYHWWGDAN